jgi:hypothetical protein
MRARYPSARAAPRENDRGGTAFAASVHAALAKDGQLRLSFATYHMTRRFLPALILGLVLCVARSICAAPLYTDEVVKLPSGHSVKVLSISRVEYSKGVMALHVRYLTKLNVEERKALSEEVDDVFKAAQKQVERDGFHEAVVTSNEVSHGIILTSNRAMNFIFERGTDGTWTRIGRSEFMAVQ